MYVNFKPIKRDSVKTKSRGQTLVAPDTLSRGITMTSFLHIISEIACRLNYLIHMNILEHYLTQTNCHANFATSNNNSGGGGGSTGGSGGGK